MDSLLVNLRKYRPRDNTDPLENFVTEAFAWILKSSAEARDAVLKLINSLLADKVELPRGDCEISTQENFAGKFPDLVITWPDCTWVFEHKVWSNLHKDQLKNYSDYIKNEVASFRIILITAKRYQHAQSPDAALCWQDIYKCLLELEQNINDENTSWALNEFLSLLNSEGLGLSTPINRFAMQHYVEAVQLDDQLASVFKQAAHLEWSLQSMGLTPAYKRRLTESRAGLEFYPKIGKGNIIWAPSIFCGVVFKGDDHGISEFLNDEINLCVAFDFNSKARKYLKSNTQYDELRSRLASLSSSGFKSWTFLDTANEPKAKHNPWHPLIFVRPMMPVFESTHTHDEQVALMHAIFEEIQKELVLVNELNVLVKGLVTSNTD